MRFTVRKLSAIIGVGAMGISLSGCIVAAVPLIMAAGAAGVAATGFVVYKTVQTSSGGSVRIAFGSSDSKTASPPQPLPPANSAAVWSNGEQERKFAETLRGSGQFRVMLAEADASSSTPDTRMHGYEEICHAHHTDLVFAAIDAGQNVQSNMLSFKRGALVHKLTLEAYGCMAHRTVWGDTMAVIVEAGGKPTPQAEIDAAAGQAWAERVLQAKAGARS